MLSVAVPAWAASTTLVIFPVIRSVESAPEGKKTTVSVDKLVRIVASRERRESLEAIQLPAESLVGRSRLSKQSIVDLLEAQPEISGSEIVGPDWITVVAPGHAKTQSKVISEARVALQDHVKSQWPDLYRNIKPVYRGQIERLPVGLDSVWSFDFSDITYLGRRSIWGRWGPRASLTMGVGAIWGPRGAPGRPGRGAGSRGSPPSRRPAGSFPARR